MEQSEGSSVHAGGPPASSDGVHVVCKGDAQLVTLDIESLEVVRRVRLTDLGHEVAIDADNGLAYVPLFGTGGVGEVGRSGPGIDVVDLEKAVVRHTIPLPAGSRAHDAAWGPDGRLYVTAEGLSAVLCVNCSTGEIVGRHPTRHSQSHMLALSRDGTHAFTVNVRPGSLSRVPLSAEADIRSVELAPHVNRLSVSPDGRRCYVADQDAPRLAVIDLATMTTIRWWPLPAIAFGTAAAADGEFLVLALRQAGRLAVLDLHTGAVVGQVEVPPGPQRVVLDHARGIAYASCAPADVVVAVDLRKLNVVAEGRPGADPDGMALVRSPPPGNRRSALKVVASTKRSTKRSTAS